MLAREHYLLERLSAHPNIIKSLKMDLNGVLEHEGQRESIVYNVLEYARNGTLSYYIRHTGALEENL